MPWFRIRSTDAQGRRVTDYYEVDSGEEALDRWRHDRGGPNGLVLDVLEPFDPPVDVPPQEPLSEAEILFGRALGKRRP